RYRRYRRFGGWNPRNVLSPPRRALLCHSEWPVCVAIGDRSAACPRHKPDDFLHRRVFKDCNDHCHVGGSGLDVSRLELAGADCRVRRGAEKLHNLTDTTLIWHLPQTAPSPRQHTSPTTWATSQTVIKTPSLISPSLTTIRFSGRC